MSMALCRYAYPKPLRNVEPVTDAFDCVSTLEAAFDYCPPLRGMVPLQAHLAGGFVRDTLLGECPSDLDLFVWSDAEMRELCDVLQLAEWSNRSRHPEIVTLISPEGAIVQLIPTDSADPVMTISRFDFTICCAAIDLSTNRGIAAKEFLPDLRRRKLRVMNPGDPEGSLSRVDRFKRRGFTIQPREHRKLSALVRATKQTLDSAPIAGINQELLAFNRN